MSRLYTKVRYAITEEVDDEDHPGVYRPRIVEKDYYGDLTKVVSKWQTNSSSTNDDISISNQISIVADPFAYENFMHIQAVLYMGTWWKVTYTEIQRPRLILSVGGVCNG